MNKILSISGLIITIVLLTMCIVFSCFLINNPYNTNNQLLVQEINTLRECEEFHINDIIPFDWDEMYVFKSGTSKEYIEKTINVSNSKITDVPEDENTTGVIFLKDGKITAYFPSTKDSHLFKVNVPMGNSNHGVVKQYEWVVFMAENKNGIINLTEMTIYRAPGYFQT